MVSRPGPQSSTSSISSANLSTHSTFDHHGRLQWVIKSLEKWYQAVWTWLDHLPTWERCWAKGINEGQRPGHAAVIGRGRDRAEVKMILVGQVSTFPDSQFCVQPSQERQQPIYEMAVKIDFRCWSPYSLCSAPRQLTQTSHQTRQRRWDLRLISYWSKGLKNKG